MPDINLTKAVRSNLSSLQNTATLMAKTQDRLSTGNKVNTALDNPTNFFTASSLNSRAGDLNNLMDSMANGIKTIEAADNGLKSITKTVESMQSTLRQARQDKSFKSVSLELDTTTASVAAGKFTISGVDISTTQVASIKGSAAPTGVAAATGGLTITVGSNTAVAIDTTAAMTAQQAVDAINNSAVAAQGISASIDGGAVKLSTADGSRIQIGGAQAGALGFGAGNIDTNSTVPATGTAYAVKTVDQLVDTINSNAGVNTKVRASADNGKLRIENLLSSADVAIGGLTGSKVSGASAATGTSTIEKNTVRGDLVNQFNDLRSQLDRLSDDASFNGINLLRGDNLKITFNESGSSAIDVKTKGGVSINSNNLGIKAQQLSVADSDASLDKALEGLSGALNKLRSQASSFGSNLSVVQNRQDFTKSMINTLETGAGNLTLADMNQEAANMMALQTRQSLASSTLSMANQADQGVLQLLR